MEQEKSQSLYGKLFKIQSTITGVKKESTNPFFNSRYFDINKLLTTLRPVLQSHKLIVMQPLSNINGVPSITTILHDIESGEYISDTMALPLITDPQKMGSAITYYRRYALQSLFLLEALDDDANLASGKSSAGDYEDKISRLKNNTELTAYYNQVKSLPNFTKEILPLLERRKAFLNPAK